MTTHPVLRGLHDVGLAAWTGGGLMGAVGLNGAGSVLDDPGQRARVATAGWTRWAPVGAAALGAHLVGAAGLLVTDWPRVRRQQGVAATSAAKTATTAAALGLAAWSAVLDRAMARAGSVPVRGATEPAAARPQDVARAQRQLQLVQWLQPAVGLGLVALTDVMSEQQRASQLVKGRLARLRPVGALTLSLGAAAATGLLLRRRRSAGARTRPAGLPAPFAPTPTGVADTAGTAAAPAGTAATPAGTAAASAGTAPASADTAPAPAPAAPAGTGAATTVTVHHEEPRVVREPIDAEAADGADRPALQEEEREVVLHAEEPVIAPAPTDPPSRGSARQ